MPLPKHKTKIVATIGPASRSPRILQSLIEAGLNAARLNFSHGDFNGHREVIHALRDAARRAGREIAILADLPGPKMRIGRLPTEPIELKPGDTFTLTSTPDVSEPARVSVTFSRLAQVVHPGAQLYLNDGMIQLEVTAIRGDDVECRIVVGGELRSRKGLNLPGLHLGMSAFTERDRECLRFALEHGVDAVSQSFVESAADVHAVREAAGALGHHPFLFAKIERAGAIAEIDPILEAADGIMIARGDLGVEVPIERIAVLQKQLMQKAVRAGKPVITATQMLESMTLSRQPTRAEVTDVANAILDGTDCVMLSAESAMGRYPVEAVETLARIAAATEPHRSPTNPWDTLMSQNTGRNYSMTDHIAVGIGAMLRLSTPAAVCVPTRSGATARTITRSRLPVWIAAATADLAVSRSLQFSYGVIPMIETDDLQDWSAFIRRWAHDHGLPGRTAILVQGPSKLNPTANHQIQLVALESSPMP